jgi:hypothetical protein
MSEVEKLAKRLNETADGIEELTDFAATTCLWLLAAGAVAVVLLIITIMIFGG